MSLKRNFDFIGIKRYAYVFSLLVTFLSVLSLVIFRLNFGIDFIGGISIEVRAKDVDIVLMRKVVSGLKVGEVSLQTFGKDSVSIRISGQVQVDQVKQALTAAFGDKIEYRRVDVVGPQVGRILMKSGIQSVLLAFLAIMVYVWFRFEWQFGLGVLIALLHDSILSIGFMSITGIDFSLSSIAAILTIIGYSVNDSVVIYDRIRENIRKYKNKAISDIINTSVNETLSRTTLTVFTTLLANLALIIFGGEAIRSFSLVMFFGVAFGTYSSIFISAPILTLFGVKKFQ